MAHKSLKLIKIDKNRPNLNDDFSSWLKASYATRSAYGYCDWWDDEEYLCGDCFDWGLDLNYRNNWGYPSDEDDDDSDWVKERKAINEWRTAYDDMVDGCDDDAYEAYWRAKSKKDKAKRKKEKEMKNANQLTEEDIDDIIYSPKTIYYYEDINREDSKRVFKNLFSFYNFLDEQGIDISDSEGAKFIREDVRHCCINPTTRTSKHYNEIISDHSYGALAYEVSDDVSAFS